jgi:branched-chain amino acid transport system substrate-binding protein
MTQRLFVLAQLSVLALATTVGACVGGVAQAADEIRIGVLTALTGPTPKFGQGQKNALTLALEEINGDGGIASLGGAKITLVYGDTRGNGDTGATETERLITEEKVVAVIGAFQSGVAMPSSAVAERLQVPWVNFATVDTLTQRGFKFIFRAHARR